MATRFAVTDPDDELVAMFHIAATKQGPHVEYSSIPVSEAGRKHFLMFGNEKMAKMLGLLLQVTTGATFKVVKLEVNNA